MKRPTTAAASPRGPVSACKSPGKRNVPRSHPVKPSSFFHYCPRCGAKQTTLTNGAVFHCAACDYTLHLSAASATGVFIQRDDGRVLFIVRAKEPAKGKLAPPGGFIDVGETAEDGVRREAREEVGVELTDVAFLCSAPNSYLYREVTYPVLDFYFVARAMDWQAARTSDEVTEIRWLKPEEVETEGLAFSSMQDAWRHWLAQPICRARGSNPSGDPQLRPRGC